VAQAAKPRVTNPEPLRSWVRIPCGTCPDRKRYCGLKWWKSRFSSTHGVCLRKNMCLLYLFCLWSLSGLGPAKAACSFNYKLFQWAASEVSADSILYSHFLFDIFLVQSLDGTVCSSGEDTFVACGGK